MLIHRQVFVLLVGQVTFPFDGWVIILDLSCSLIDFIGSQDRISWWNRGVSLKGC